MINAEELNKQIRELIANNDLESAINLLIRCYEGDTKKDSVLLYSAKYYELRKSLRDGLVDFEIFQRKMTRLRSDILEFLRHEKNLHVDNAHISKHLKSDFKRSIARLSIIHLLSIAPYKDTGLSITEIQTHSMRKNRKYIAESVLELATHAYLEKAVDEDNKINLWKLSEEGWDLAEELNNSLFRQ